MTITLSLSLVVGLALSAALFVAVTVLCWHQGMFDGGGGYAGGLDAVFTVIAYTLCWAVPSLAGWAIYATWFGGT